MVIGLIVRWELLGGYYPLYVHGVDSVYARTPRYASFPRLFRLEYRTVSNYNALRCVVNGQGDDCTETLSLDVLTKYADFGRVGTLVHCVADWTLRALPSFATLTFAVSPVRICPLMIPSARPLPTCFEMSLFNGRAPYFGS